MFADITLMVAIITPEWIAGCFEGTGDGSIHVEQTKNASHVALSVTLQGPTLSV